MPEHGRLRYGAKGDKGQPRSLAAWRFTSHDETALGLLAEKYGGQARPWSPSKGRTEFEVLSDATTIDVVVPANALGDSPVYELWTAAGLQRRCDGERCMAPVQTRDGAELAEQGCVCDRQGAMACKPVTRASLLIPDIPFNGTWRLEAKGWNAAHELPGMIEMVGQLTAGGRFARAQLALEKRTTMSGGKTHHFMVPVIRMPTSLEEIVEGGASLTGLPAGDPNGEAMLALPPGITVDASNLDDPALNKFRVEDDQVADAEIIEDAPDPRDEQLRTVRGLILELDLSSPDVAGFVFGISEGMVEKVEALDLAELMRLARVLGRVAAGELEYTGLNGRRAVVIGRQVS